MTTPIERLAAEKAMTTERPFRHLCPEATPPDNLDHDDDLMDFEESFGIPLHPDADKFKSGTWDEPGQCICGAPLPPQKEWDDAGGAWPHVTCSACGRGYVDEEEFVAIYDEGLDPDEDKEPITSANPATPVSDPVQGQ